MAFVLKEKKTGDLCDGRGLEVWGWEGSGLGESCVLESSPALYKERRYCLLSLVTHPSAGLLPPSFLPFWSSQVIPCLLQCSVHPLTFHGTCALKLGNFDELPKRQSRGAGEQWLLLNDTEGLLYFNSAASFLSPPVTRLWALG